MDKCIRDVRAGAIGEETLVPSLLPNCSSPAETLYADDMVVVVNSRADMQDVAKDGGRQ